MITITRALPLCMGLFVVVAAFGSPANLLVDPSFELNPLDTLVNIATTPLTKGVWGAENGVIVSGIQPDFVSPYDGTKMLCMADDGLSYTQTFQFTDVSAYASLIDSGKALATACGYFDTGDFAPGAGIGYIILHFAVADAWPLTDGSATNSLTLDSNPFTWQYLDVSAVIPVGVRYIGTEVLYNNASLAGHNGYVDATCLNVVPEPGSIGLLATAAGSALLMRRRRR
jgi:hypothetical protein